MQKINLLAKQHYDWVESRNWHNKTPLESIALIGSEIGEALEEAFLMSKDKLHLEIADIYLRSMDLAVEFNIGLDQERNENYFHFQELNFHAYGSHIIEHLAYLTIPLAKLANTTRYHELPPEFSISLVKFMLSIEKLCDVHKIPLFENINKKIQINLEKNHQNRVK